MSAKSVTRRHRRQKNMTLRSGGKFKVGHKNPAGRIGNVQAKRTPAGKRGKR